MKPTLLAIVGKPLAGKDTQADLLVTHYPESVKISTGHIIRAVREEGETHRFWPVIGPYVPMMEQGMKLPDEPVLAMLREMISEQFAEGKTMLVIAGSPRGEDQLVVFEKMAEENGANFLLFHIDATDEETYRRSALRNEGRVDDTPEVHKVRLAEFETHVAPMVDRLRKEGKIIDIDGMQPIENVRQDIEMHLAHFIDPEGRPERKSEAALHPKQEPKMNEISEETHAYRSEVLLKYSSEMVSIHITRTVPEMINTSEEARITELTHTSEPTYISEPISTPEMTLPPMARR